MHQFVQSAIDAANQGDKNKAMSFLKEVLAANPKDADAWLVLAAILDDPERKRQCLNRVLSLDPTNKLAREDLREMDRSAMGGTLPFTLEPEPVPVSKPKSQPKTAPPNIPATQPTPTQANHVSLKEWKEDTPKEKAVMKARAEKPTIFKYSTVTRIATYISAAIFMCFGLAAVITSQDLAMLVFPCGLSLVIVPAIWIVSKQVEVSEKNIRVSQLFGLIGSEIGWGEIARIKSNAMQRNLELFRKKGGSLKVTTQVNGYPAIVETLHQKRPDLFGLAQPQPSSAWGNGTAAENGNSPSMGYDIPSTTPSFSGTRTFKKSFIRQYGILFVVVPMGVLAVLAAFEPQNRVGAIIAAVVCFLLLFLPFLQVGLVKVEPNKLTVESFLEQKEFSARQIKEIKMASVRGRYGRVTNYVNIVPVQGKNYPMQGFADGDEIIYGILQQWWESYKNR